MVCKLVAAQNFHDQGEIKCSWLSDETRPHCLRCQKARIYCAGYREQFFISFEAGEDGLRRLVLDLPQSTEPPEASPLSTRRETLRIDRPLPLVVSENVCISYARAHLPRDWCLESQWHINSTGKPSETTDINRYLVQFALRSLAKTLFAYRKQHPEVMREGLSLYRRVLSAVNRALAAADCAQRLDLVEAILALRAFDVR